MRRISGIFAAATFVLAVSFVGGDAQAASSSIVCGGHTVTVSTGTSSGSCVKSGTVITCNDSGTSVGGGCDSNGAASCGNAVGSGTCGITKAMTTSTTVKKVMPTAVGATEHHQ
jgi:hypothetical protein